jgi:probable phosphoglycerate mutase
MARTSGAGSSEIVLVRHGQGRCNADGIIGGDRGCTGLSARGHAQTEALARCLAAMAVERPFDALYCSPRRRVQEGAAVIGAALRLPVTVVPALRGQDFGAADGRSWRVVTAGFGGTAMDHPDVPIAVGAESWNRYAARVLRAVTDLLQRHGGDRIVVIGHGKTTGLAGALLRGDPDPAASAGDHVIEHGHLAHWRREAAPGSGSGWVLLVPPSMMALAVFLAAGCR